MPSRMIGENVRVHVYHDRLALFIGQTLTSTLPRVYLKAGQERGKCIDYRHIIHSLSAKPQAWKTAFKFCQFYSKRAFKSPLANRYPGQSR